MAQSEAHNFRLISHDLMSGFGNVGEGMSLQLAKGGRRIMWMAHECAPKNFTAVEVTDPRKPKVIVQTDLPHRNVRSNSLEICGDVMAVAYQTGTHGATPAGIELFDISTPEEPKRIASIDRSGPRSRGVHQLWFIDGKTIHCSSGAVDFMPRNLKDDQCYTAFDVISDEAPGTGAVVVSGDRGTRCGAAGASPSEVRYRWRAHNTNVYPERPDRAYVGYIDGGACVLDISDIGAPKLAGHWNPHPPFPGFTHTVMPLFDRDLYVVSDECVRTGRRRLAEAGKRPDARREDNLVSMATLPIPPMEDYALGGRYGAHNLWENRPGPAFQSSTLVFGTYFGGGLRVHDISDPLQPKEVASFIPEPPDGSPMKAGMINDVYVDENRLVYTVDRFAGGLYVLEMTV